MSVKLVLLVLLEKKLILLKTTLISVELEPISPVNIKSELRDFVSYVSLNIVGALKEEKKILL
jgi:hypothetical protein